MVYAVKYLMRYKALMTDGYSGAAQQAASNQDQGYTEQRKWLVALGKQIRRLRAERGFSQVGFAIRAGFARAYYSSLERGERNVSAINLVRLARALDIEVGALFPPISELAENENYSVTPELTTVEEPHNREELRSGVAETQEKQEILVSAGAAAVMIGVNRRTIERWVREGTIRPAVRVKDQRGKEYSVFWPEDIEQLSKARRE